MKKYLLFLFLVSLSLKVFSQNDKTDNKVKNGATIAVYTHLIVEMILLQIMIIIYIQQTGILQRIINFQVMFVKKLVLPHAIIGIFMIRKQRKMFLIIKKSGI